MNFPRESSSIYVCRYLIAEGASLHIYDPKVTSERIFLDLAEQTGKTEKERKKIDSINFIDLLLLLLVQNNVEIANEPYAAAKDSHAIVVCTEWAEFAVR